MTTILTLCGVARAQTFTSFAPPAGRTIIIPTASSADGSVIVGVMAGANFVNPRAFRWTAASGVVDLGTLTGFAAGSEANATNGDGTIVVGSSEGVAPAAPVQAFRWSSAGGMAALALDGTSKVATGVSADGTVVTGYRVFANAIQSFRWTAAGGFVDIGLLPGTNTSSATGISADGQVIVGTGASSTTTGRRAFRWTAATGLTELGVVPRYTESAPTATNADGSVVVGTSFDFSTAPQSQAFMWTAATGLVGLGAAPGHTSSALFAVSSDGNVAAGQSTSRFVARGDAARWSSARRWETIRQLLIAQGIDLTAWVLERATALSGDGSVIIGYGLENNLPRVWIARLTPPPVPASRVLAATLPSARTTFVPGGPPVTGFAAIVNAAPIIAINCSLAAPFDLRGTFTYQTTNAQNQLTGTPNTPINIPEGAVQNFVFSVAPSVQVAADFPLIMKCFNSPQTPPIYGLNTFIVSAGPTQISDMLAIATTPSNDGIVNIPGPNGTGIVATATINIGAAATVTCAPSKTPFGQPPRTLPVNLFICQTNPSTGTCINPTTPGVSTTLSAAANQTSTFTIFVQGTGTAIAFDPAFKRIFFQCSQGATPVGQASVAVRTQ